MLKSGASFALLLITALTSLQAAVAAERDIRLIRDAEIEDTIRLYATPLFQAAGLNAGAIDVYLVNDKSLNAFVTSGLRMFIHTGLLMRSEEPTQVIGVLAHETGHLAAGHTASRSTGVAAARNSIIASYVLGLGAALVTGRPEVAQAVITGGQDIALKGLLSYTRGQEQAADQYAVRLLNGTGHSPEGLLGFMRILRGQEALLSSSQDPYLRSHPLTQERIAYLEDEVAHSPHRKQPTAADLIRRHQRMRAKLVGFLQPFERVVQLYPDSDRSLPALYARAIAHFRTGDFRRALPLIDGLISDHPDDPYLHELRGQMLFEGGRLRDALESYQAAVERLPDSHLIGLSLAQVAIEVNRPDLDALALRYLQRFLASEPQNAFAWRLTAIAHGRAGEVGRTALALAESALARGDLAEARNQARRAKSILAEGSPGHQRARDIEELARGRQSGASDGG